MRHNLDTFAQPLSNPLTAGLLRRPTHLRRNDAIPQRGCGKRRAVRALWLERDNGSARWGKNGGIDLTCKSC